MNEDGQFEFDDLPYPGARNSDRLPSHKAARIARLRQGTHAYQLAVLLEEHAFGLTNDEAQEMLPGHDGRHHKRMPDLVAGGYAEDSGLVKPTRTGCEATIWVITEKGRQELLRLKNRRNGT